ncbi:HigA family addiction module antitoxin [Allohahella sp. A8]|uniref:HigA family addiction module antitoxin n=1 Tax=Allohahella sp. A8 TaxID=3141461 RepID=UPI000C09971C|nr:addiction module antidote protein, HigA family [Hahellaceae bacterium]
MVAKLKVSASTLARLLKGSSGVSLEMALRLSRALNRSPDCWLAMQDLYDLSVARGRLDFDSIERIGFEAA